MTSFVRKALIITLTLGLTFALSACGNESSETTNNYYNSSNNETINKSQSNNNDKPMTEPQRAEKFDGNPHSEDNPIVVVETSLGSFEAEIYENAAPVSAANFLSYVDAGFFSNTIFHRVMKDFMIQGGGFTTDFKEKSTNEPIINEAENGLKNTRGTLAMARTGIIDSATSQFFVNTVDNEFLNNGGRDFGYAVFGTVVSGMDVVDAIEAVETGNQAFGASPIPMQNVPKEVVEIISITKK